MTIALALHGGAGARRKFNYDKIRKHMRGVVEQARDELLRGDAAIDVAERTVAEMEASGLYVAGKGGSPNLAGDYELDASIMDGAIGSAGAVACLTSFAHPIRVARLVMERTPHVLLSGAGAESFARTQDAEEIPDAPGWFTHAGAGESNHAPGMIPHGTVGCAVLDQAGRLASATSSAGVFEKTPGRIGDSPIIGAGTWADGNVAVSCTGQGELFLQTAAAARIAFQCEAGVYLQAAVGNALAAIQKLGGEGGVAAVDRSGLVSLASNAEGMKRASLSADGAIRAFVFDDE